MLDLQRWTAVASLEEHIQQWLDDTYESNTSAYKSADTTAQMALAALNTLWAVEDAQRAAKDDGEWVDGKGQEENQVLNGLSGGVDMTTTSTENLGIKASTSDSPSVSANPIDPAHISPAQPSDAAPTQG